MMHKININGATTSALLSEGKRYLNNDEPTAALRSFNIVLKRDENNATAYAYRECAHLALNQMEKATADANQYMALLKDIRISKTSHSEVFSYLMTRIGNACLEQKQYGTASRILFRAYSSDPNNETARELKEQANQLFLKHNQLSKFNNGSTLSEAKDPDVIQAGEILFSIHKTPKSFQGKLPDGTTLSFTEEKVSAEGHCGFLALGASRHEVADYLLTHSKDSKQRMKLLLMIEEAFENDLVKHIEWNTLRDQRTSAEYKYDKTLSLLCETIEDIHGAWKNIPNETQSQKAERALRLFPVKIQNDMRNTITNLERQIETIRNKAHTFFRSELAYTVYVNAFRENLWLDQHSAMLYAETRNISLYVWTESGRSNQLTLENSQVAEVPTQEIHMFHTAGLTHFNLLICSERAKPVTRITSQSQVIYTTQFKRVETTKENAIDLTGDDEKDDSKKRLKM